MSAPPFGKTRFCDDANIAQSRSYINTSLYARGFVRDASAALKFNSADAPTVINLVYDFLKRSEWEELQRERLTTRVRQDAGDLESLRQQNDKLTSRVAQLEQAAGVAKNHLAAAKQETAGAIRETKLQKDQLSRVSLALQHIKTQMANDLRKRDLQIARLKEQFLDGALSSTNLQGSRRGGKLTGLMRIHGSGSVRAQPMQHDTRAALQLQAESEQQLTTMVQEVAQENDALAELLQATLASLESLVPLEEAEDAAAPLVRSVAQSIIMLEAQLQVRLTALRSMLEMPNYVPLEEVERRDIRISELSLRLQQIETEWSAARSVLKGLTASVLSTGQAAKPNNPDDILSDGVEQLSKVDAAIAASSSILQETPRAKINTAQPATLLRAMAKTPLVIGQENGKMGTMRGALSTVKVDARLMGLDMQVPLVDQDATPIRARKARRNRRTTIGLLRQEQLDEELTQVLGQAQ
ncbi:Afadin and alpha-actinin-binding-domain-containing protein [Protomyces lactucae-debilis]|uniref:Afadin and alpha-actinin-binding-domain-containing protein n=1 Tax=Protomyces lactucae-debilis TaxID=2754530 RepID=A0A1Y2EZI6_PROLT|nr:Afadin and alpha-actinin-binding-domain-containing protein [Protomyces lactucae-debilis]ORY77042.1 Afadin and alpha-actinin-binding-domain-containing protein [Protomyces lactucae-debilis]